SATGKVTDMLWHGRTTAMERDGDTYWLGTVEGVYTNIKGKTAAFGKGTLLQQSRVTAILKTCDSDIAFGTHQGGVFIWDRKKLWHITEKDGLSSNICKKMLIDKCCNLWVAT